MTVVFDLGKTAKTLSFHHVGFVPFVENQIASLPTLLTPVRPDSLRTHSPVSFTPNCLVGHRPLLTATLRKGWEGRGFKTIPPAVDSFPFYLFWMEVCVHLQLRHTVSVTVCKLVSTKKTVDKILSLRLWRKKKKTNIWLKKSSCLVSLPCVVSHEVIWQFSGSLLNPPSQLLICCEEAARVSIQRSCLPSAIFPKCYENENLVIGKKNWLHKT